MPKTINWETQEISFYKFVCKNPDILFSYVGHTVSFRHRKSGHKSRCLNPNDKGHNLPLYIFMREHGGFENWNMIEIHTQICKNKRDAERIETELMEQQQLKLNAIRAYTSEEHRKEQLAKWYNENKEQIAKQHAEYYENHKEQKATYNAEYRKEHKEQLAIKQAKKYYEQNKEQLAIKRTEYYEKNKEKNAIKHAKWREENRDIINAKQRAKRALQKAQLNCEILDATNP